MRVSGFADLRKQLRGLPKAVGSKILRNGLRAGARVIRDEARIRAPKKSGRLAKSIKVKARKKKGGVIGVKVVTGTREELQIRKDDPYYYPQHVELGHKAGGINKSGKPVPPHPYMRPAFDSKVGQAEQAIRQEINRGMDEYLKGPPKE